MIKKFVTRELKRKDWPSLEGVNVEEDIRAIKVDGECLFHLFFVEEGKLAYRTGNDLLGTGVDEIEDFALYTRDEFEIVLREGLLNPAYCG